MSEESKYVSFRLGKEDYGVPIEQVISIERMDLPTAIPKVPPHIRGVLDVRGTVMPVADLRIYLMDRVADDTEETRIIIVDVEGQSMGLVVDEAKDVIDLDQEEIQPLSLKGAASESVIGIGKTSGRLIILLNLAQLLDELDPETIMQELQEVMEEESLTNELNEDETEV